MSDIEWIYNDTTYPFNYIVISKKLEKINDDRLSSIVDFIKDHGEKIVVGLKNDAQTIFTIKKHNDEDWYIMVLDRNILKKSMVYAESMYIYYIAKLMDYSKFREINDKIFKSKTECKDIDKQIQNIHEYAKNMEESNYIPRLLQSIYLNKYERKLLDKDDILYFVYKNNTKENFMKSYNNMLQIPLSVDEMYTSAQKIDSSKIDKDQLEDVSEINEGDKDDPEIDADKKDKEMDPKIVIRTIFEKYKNKYIQKGIIHYIDKCYKIT